MKVILIVFPKKILIQNYWAILGRETAHPRNAIPTVRIFLHNERGQAVHGSSVDGFPNTAYPHNFRSALKTFSKFCKMKTAKRRFKFILMVFF